MDSCTTSGTFRRKRKAPPFTMTATCMVWCSVLAAFLHPTSAFIKPLHKSTQHSSGFSSSSFVTPVTVSIPHERNTQRTATSSSQDSKRSQKADVGASVRSSSSFSRRKQPRKRKKYRRKREKPPSEKARDELCMKRQAEYDKLRVSGSLPPSIFSFEGLFPAPVWDEESIQKDLYGDDTTTATTEETNSLAEQSLSTEKERVIDTKANPRVIQWKTPRSKAKLTDKSSLDLPEPVPNQSSLEMNVKSRQELPYTSVGKPDLDLLPVPPRPGQNKASSSLDDDKLSILTPVTASAMDDEVPAAPSSQSNITTNNNNTTAELAVDRQLSRMVADRVYGFRRTQTGDFSYDTSLMGDGAVKFRDGIRLGNPLKVNADRLTYHARKELSRGKVEEAQELYERAIEIDPRDGRAYLGLSKVAEKRRDFAYARECLRQGIANSVTPPEEGPEGTILQRDSYGNPFLLQALGWLEERMGHLAEAEALYISAAKSRPSHAAAWVALAQPRTKKLRQGANAGRVCFQTAERELQLANLRPSSHVYTAWASLEYKNAGDTRRARELFKEALKIDPKCSAAWLQLGVMEADKENWEQAEDCFETVLKFDQRNSRVLQAYAIMESKRPDGDSRRAIDLFERALKANPRDAGVLQGYALYVAKLGDVDSARDLLRRGTEVNKRDAAVWQAWGVLETRHGTAAEARDIFQQGIWACAQLGGGQSGGWRCARLWQAWGVLEAQEGDFPAARRCFSRALGRGQSKRGGCNSMDIDGRGVGDDKMAIWRAYEVMEERAGNMKAAQHAYQRSIRESMTIRDDYIPNPSTNSPKQSIPPPPDREKVLRNSNEVEVVRWQTRPKSNMAGEVWMNNGSIEGKVPDSMMKKARNKKKKLGPTETPSPKDNKHP